MKKTIFSKLGSISFYIIVILLCLTTVYPFVYTFFLSFLPQGYSGLGIEDMLNSMNLGVWKSLLNSKYLWRGFYNSVIRTALGGFLSVALTVGMAYPLSKREFFGYKFFNKILVLSMLLNAGTIPTYLLIKNLNMLNTVWSLVLPSAISVYNLIILKKFMESLPKSIEESAIIDGANDIVIFFKIILPLSMPSIATIALWVLVGNWNSWFDVILYINSRSKFLLPAILNELIVDNQVDISMTGGQDLAPTTDSLKAGATMFTTIPILLVYPFLQKHFTKGIMLGAVKG